VIFKKLQELREASVTSKYALIGAAGYIAPRHLKAIKETNGILNVAFDVNDSVGIIDSYFPDSSFFTEFEQFDAYIDSETRNGRPIDYTSICSPNYLHKSHIGYALRSNSHAICEKPLVLEPKDLDDLSSLESQTGFKVNTILQLRLHPSIVALRKKVKEADPKKIYDVDLGYFTSRGSWYHSSWKGMLEKSGGIATNIGVHFYDMLGYVFGEVKENIVHYRGLDASAGYLEFEQARVRWLLSINRDHLPEHTPTGQTTHRSITIEGEEMEFSGGFTDLHTSSYQNILNNNGYGLEDVRSCIEIVSDIRNSAISMDKSTHHPSLQKILKS